MMAKKKNVSSKVFAKQKNHRRGLLSFFRICRYGFDSFIRNSWLSVAATAVMTITLLIVFTTFVAQNVLTNTVGDLRDKVDMSIYLKTETTNEEANSIITELKKLSSVRSVTYVSADEARSQIVEANKDDNDVLEAIKAATNKNPATLRVIINDINDTSQLQDFVDNNTLLKDYISSDYEPSFAGERRNTIQSIGRAVNFAQQVGIIAGSVFVAISALIIFNTIRMAIFNRKEEIQMMKLIGANQSFIRGPFLVESIIYGLIAALAATAIGFFGLYKVSGTLASYQISVQSTIDLVTQYSVVIVLIMMAIGAVIGIASSLLATHKYLKL
ncbi:MAG: cell division transport system permease protein [Patescibacteria group bacterium]|nr:cell division transport system permease protein [Patescibacteria group bacterium]